MAAPSTPRLHGALIPSGHVLLNEKWRDSEIGRSIKENHIRIMYDDHMSLVDFHPSNKVAIVFLPEAELIGGIDYKGRILKLTKSSFRCIVIAERTPLSEQYFAALQKFVVIERSLALLPVTTQSEAGKIIAHMVKMENKPANNPYRIKMKPVQTDKALLGTVQSIPGLGQKKALALLKEFKSIEVISRASVEAMSRVVGKACAEQVKTFIDNSNGRGAIRKQLIEHKQS
ncbi:Fanconi anemia core complex-associated protein 24 [Nematostella vectensis]|uniref:Fanconi anemia core complex-associated protein 24 n=1 Tax=Nematostella vectensis TaxID=45351 RepID=UPI0020778A8B|nr:Fanconi anemia core complex-associated protein 24 [Nematostella vectensis]